MFAICRDGTRYLQKHGSRYEWVTTKSPEYFLTRNDILLISITVVGDDGKTYDFYIEEGTSEVFRMIFETIPHGLSDINRRLDAMNTELDGVDNDDND